jgi:hypothetical protein
MSSDVVLQQRGAAAAVGRWPVGTPDVTVGQAGDQEVRGRGSKRTGLAASLLLQTSVLESGIGTARKVMEIDEMTAMRAGGWHRRGYKPAPVSLHATQKYKAHPNQHCKERVAAA